jgi:hypothetical protein
MQRSCPWHIKVRLIWAVAVMGLSVAAGHVEADADKDFEVWAIDQSDSPGATFGGTLYIYHGQDLIKASGTAVPEVIDLGGAVSALCLAETGANPVRPHIVLFNSTHTHAILAFVASGHVVFIEAATRTPIKCLRMSLGFNNNRQAHAAFPSPDDRYVMVANQTGKLLERIDTDADNDGTPYEDADDIVHDPDATLNLATCTTPSGAPCEQADVRPNNTVICPIIDRTSTLTFITLAGGGLLVADTSADSAAPPSSPSMTRPRSSPMAAAGCRAVSSQPTTGFTSTPGPGPATPLRLISSACRQM